jgi:hypothetical protein
MLVAVRWATAATAATAAIDGYTFGEEGLFSTADEYLLGARWDSHCRAGSIQEYEFQGLKSHSDHPAHQGAPPMSARREQAATGGVNQPPSNKPGLHSGRR